MKFFTKQIDTIRISELEKALKYLEQARGHLTIDGIVHGAIYFCQFETVTTSGRDGNIGHYNFIDSDGSKVGVSYEDVPHYMLLPNSLESLFPEWEFKKVNNGYKAIKNKGKEIIETEFLWENTITKLRILIKVAIFEIKKHHELNEAGRN